MRELTTHRLASGQVDPVNDVLEILADEAGPGEASQYYEVLYRTDEHDGEHVADLEFASVKQPQGLLTNECLLAVLIDRLEGMGMQHGPQACVQNRGALAYLHAALSLLKTRTRDRQERHKVDKHRGK